MNYFAGSAWSYLEKKIQKVKIQAGGFDGRRLLVMVPALSEPATLSFAEKVASKCAADATVHLTLKIAQVVTNGWTLAGLVKADAHGWLDNRGNLTYYRNLPPISGRLNIVILCGADRVTDAGGLADFHTCDLKTIWQDEMKSSFQGWVKLKLQGIGITSLEPVMLKDFDRLIKPLLDQGRGDLLQISSWLETINLNAAGSVEDVLKIILRSLGDFQLPVFARFPLGRRSITLASYIEKAHAFFSYSMFLDSKEREKATKAIDKIVEVIAEGGEIDLHLDDSEVCGPYGTTEALLEGLKKYIQTEDRTEREQLKQCDFVTIIDEILKYRRRGEEPPKEQKSIRKISGSSVEMILHAIWQTFRDFARDRRYSDARVIRVEISGERFKHDYESNEGNLDAVVDRNELARQYLLRLIGGVDQLIARHIELPGIDGEPLPVACQLADNDIACSYSKTAEPSLEFTVCLMHDAESELFCRKFAWRLPEIHSYRLAESLIHWAKDALASESGIWKLPVFHLPYYEELLRATDDEETRRVMLHCIRDAHFNDTRVTNMLSNEWLESGDDLLPTLKLLAEKYDIFVHSASSKGLYAALFASDWTDLRQAYTSVCEQVIQRAEDAESQMTAMLMRGFLVVQQRQAEAGAVWASEPFERSGLATVLHPAVLEMLEAQVLFLFTCFNTAARAEWERAERRKAFAEKIWNGYVDLASIQAPIAGLLYNADLNLDTNIRGQDLIHRIGSPENREAMLTTRLLLREDSGAEDEEVSDADMFREGRESKLLYRLMMDYFRLHPHARDGLTIAVFRNKDIQPVISAVHQYLTRLSDEKDRRYYVLTPDRRKPYAISVTIFTEATDDVDVARWIEQWRERWEAAETDSKFKAYRSCRFSVAHRLVAANQLSLFQQMINNSLEADIVVLYDFIGAGQGGNKFTEVVPFDILSRTLKFPILEKSCCSIRHPVDRYKRSRVMSNLQFSLGKMHTQIMHRLKNQGVQPGKEFVILGYGDYTPWRSVIDAVHSKAEWVICIDPNIDERLVKVPAGAQAHEREIIGFGSGVGSHGEANYTISTEQFSLADVRVRLTASVQEVYASQGWSIDDCHAVASCVLQQARELSGLSLVRATGVGHYIRDFMAYSITRRMLRENGPVLCDHLISLDAYRHWFDMADDERRPDLMWLTARLDEHNRVCVEMRLIECKIAGRAEEHLIKARTQINNGLGVLTSAFAPRSQQDDDLNEENRPDQRYWWLQLHRLIASKAEIENQQQAEVLSALERLAEGDYDIVWGAAVFAFWTDSDSQTVRRIGRWSVGDTNPVTADIYEMGSEFVRKLAIDGTGFPVNWNEWKELSQKDVTNVCDVLSDIELPTGAEDDEDTPEWDDQSSDIEPEEGMEGRGEEVRPETEEAEAEKEPARESNAEEFDPVQGETAILEVIEQTPSSSAPSEPSVVSPSASIPKRILLGKTVVGNKSVYWEFGHPDVANRHMLIFGTSGMGKTYAIQCFLSELGRSGQNSLVIDYTDGFIPSKLEQATAKCLNPKQHFIQQAPLPISPFKSQVSHEAGIEFRDTPITIAKRVAAIFKSVYELGNQQFPVLIDAVTEGVERFGDDFSLMQLLEILQSYIDDESHATGTVRTTISKLKPFIQGNPFAADKGQVGWLELFSDEASRCHVFQFFKVDKHSARALIEFVLWDLYAFVSSFGNKDTPRVVILDEVQNLDLGPDAPVAKYLTEGRKHGLALITATQTVKGVGGVNDARVSRLFQAEQKIFFKPTENEMREHAQLLHNAISNVNVQKWSSRLASLQKGECWTLGRSLNEMTGNLMFQAQRIKITSLEERGFNG